MFTKTNVHLLFDIKNVILHGLGVIFHGFIFEKFVGILRAFFEDFIATF